ncbi:MAG: mannose-1-phosphate guanylyltransferase/mannose-6-phosphate isomerase [Vampirovibrionales bacterium]|nr:mannose-1-phosphate guanylyltransferase/mannose-6-phosphate isomerase [Vampirovibrionales bacterium]
MLIPVILSGGAGSRLWPISRPERPKQFLSLSGSDSGHSLLQETLLRLSGLPDLDAPILICNDDHRFLLAEQLRALNIRPTAILLEPIGRNTAPAVAFAALEAVRRDPDATLLVLPSDHAITDAEAFRAVAQAACQAAQAGYLTTFGIQPDAPKTGYGYIQRGEPLEDLGATGDYTLYAVSRFVEKPDKLTAREFVRAGDFFWNSGMFVFRADRYLEELTLFQPAMRAACEQALDLARRDADFTRLDRASLETCPSGSIDYAVMEKTAHAAVAPVEMGWNDIGSWRALWEMGMKDANDNAVLREGPGRVFLEESQDCLIYAQTPGKTVAALGVAGLIIVDAGDALLVAHKSQEQAVRRLARAAASQNAEETSHVGAT